MTHRTVGEALRAEARVLASFGPVTAAYNAHQKAALNDALDGIQTQIEARRERIATACLAALVGGSEAQGFMVGPELAATAVCLADDLAAALDGPKPRTAWDDAPRRETNR